MFKSKIINFFKLCWLHITYISKNIFKNFLIKISILFVIFSFLISLFFMIPSLFSRVPIFSYLVENLSLPLSYEFEGTVVILNNEEEPIDETVNVFVGGYSMEVFSGEPFVLSFASECTNYFYVTIEYTNEKGEKEIITEKIETNNKTKIKKVIKIYV